MMLGFLWLIPVLPFAGFVILALWGRPLSHRGVSIVGVGSVGLSALLSILAGVIFLVSPPAGNAYTQELWSWIQVGRFTPAIAFRLDALSLVMVLVVTFVGFLIHLYSTEYMQADEGYSRFFAYMNLFVGSMLTLVLADDLLLLYLGWEGVGLCSYLLIGFWYKDPANGYAARKAFVVTRVGDTAMAIGLFLLFANLGTLNIQGLMQQASQQWPVGAPLAVTAAALLLGGAVGKSAQLPLQTWLPDAMAGPTPVSALIHAATMVTAGVYLIARTHVLFQLAPSVELVVALVGAVTLLLAGFSALTQVDIKRVLAYSTISQIGYMFLALGVGAWPAAIFHFMTHAFFKALLFLGAGVVLHVLNEEHNMFKMGGLRRSLPVTFWTFLIGSASLSALPLITAGFYSKDLILWDAFSSPIGSPWLWAAGLAGAFLTSLYTFRMLFLTFFGTQKMKPNRLPTLRMQAPLVILAVLSLVAGFVELPPALGKVTLFSNFLSPVLPDLASLTAGTGAELLLAVIAGVVSLLGIYLAYLLFLRRPQITAAWASTSWGSRLRRFWLSGWGFDALYNRVFVWPYTALARINKEDVIDTFYDGLAWLAMSANRALSLTQNGRLRWYALGLALGAVIWIGLVVFL
jgi:NADH-quinone oxidoreductase subunit L